MGKKSTVHLGNLVEQDIHDFMFCNNQIFSCEAEFQHSLALYLRCNGKGQYNNVYLEYFVPNSTLTGNIWGKDFNVDIVVEKGGQFVPIELKYRTKKINLTLSSFGQSIQGVSFLRNQSAIHIGTYDFWKDVRRLEILSNRFPNIVDGVAVILTNDNSYLMKRKPGSQSAQMSIEPGCHNRSRHWGAGSSNIASKSRLGFNLDNCYYVKWLPATFNNVDFNYCLINFKTSRNCHLSLSNSCSQSSCSQSENFSGSDFCEKNTDDS